MPKKGNPTASDSNFKDEKPAPRPKLFKRQSLNLWDILEDPERPKHKGNKDVNNILYKLCYRDHFFRIP